MWTLAVQSMIPKLQRVDIECGGAIDGLGKGNRIDAMDRWGCPNGRIRWGCRGDRRIREGMWGETAKTKGNWRAILKPNIVETS